MFRENKPLTFRCVLAFFVWCAVCDLRAAESGRLQIRVTGDAGAPLSCCVFVLDSTGKPHRPKSLPFWRDHFACDGDADLELPPGRHTVEVERGPEFEKFVREVQVEPNQTVRLDVSIRRIADMAADGWHAGDLHVHRPMADVPLLMRAGDLHVAPVISWWNKTNLWADREPPEKLLLVTDGDRYSDVMAGEDEREGGALLFFHLKRPLAIANAGREYPSPMKFVELARQQPESWIDIEKPFWWDVPVWLATAQPDSIGLANNHMCRDRMYENEAWGKPRDVRRLPSPRGNGFWSQEIYYHILNCGLRIPPSAGSASGVLPNPVGYNRVYVHTDQQGKLTDVKAWWSGLKAGRSFVTNGPLLDVRAENQLPGHVFQGPAGRALRIRLSVRLACNEGGCDVQVIRNGEQVTSFKSQNNPGTNVSQGKGWATVDLGELTVDRSGWFLVRTISDNPRTFRFASTAPFYVEVGDTPRRISKASARFFLDWANERAERVRRKLDDPKQLREVLPYHDRARTFWQQKLDAANAP